jgi:hypothetical protein
LWKSLKIHGILAPHGIEGKQSFQVSAGTPGEKSPGFYKNETRKNPNYPHQITNKFQ